MFTPYGPLSWARRTALICVLLALGLLAGCQSPESPDAAAENGEVAPEPPPPPPVPFGEVVELDGIALTVVDWTEIRDIADGDIAVTLLFEATVLEPGKVPPPFGLFCPNVELPDEKVSTGSTVRTEAFDGFGLRLERAVSDTGSYFWPTRESGDPPRTAPVMCPEAYVRATDPTRTEVLAQWEMPGELLAAVNDHIVH